ncbi:hypothetical protein [Nocardioides terrisoli]|uniref:hypothetical protein n=1 Tax=Nocardioides terrisoli TaxID=3388267 RepID=UPI00287B9CB4|nr:hypothetical protein [Nocardioides marmorisolisilvae]
MSRLAALGIAAVVAVALDVILVLRGGDLVVATVAVFAGVAVVAVVLDVTSQSPAGWIRPSGPAPTEAAPDPGLSALRRLIDDNQSAKLPDDRLRQRLLHLVRARHRPDRPLDDVLTRLDERDHPVRLTPAQLAGIIDRIEKL